MRVSSMSSERYANKTVYHLHLEKDIEVGDEGFIFTYDKKDWIVYREWIISKENNIIVVSDFERLNKKRKRTYIIDGLLDD